VFYWTSLAVASWIWSIILEDNRFKPYSTGFRKFFLLLYLLFFDLFLGSSGKCRGGW